MYGEEYYSHKGSYGINTMLVCDDRQCIRYVSTGWAGSVHDNRVYNSSTLCSSPERYFNSTEYILADSAYAASNSVVPAYKAKAGKAMDKRHAKFNVAHARARVRVENCNALLKGKFQSLKAMRLRIMSDKDAVKVGRYIRACCVLHNFLLNDDFDWREHSKNVDEDDDDEEAEPFAVNDFSRREVLLNLLFPQ